MIQQKINKWNAWLHRNLFWVVVFFAFWITILIGLVGYGIWLGDIQRSELNIKSDQSLINDSVATLERGMLMDSVSIQWRKSFKNLNRSGK